MPSLRTFDAQRALGVASAISKASCSALSRASTVAAVMDPRLEAEDDTEGGA
jgi:hypothetical protein